MNYQELESIPELARQKPADVLNVFKAFFTQRQGGKSSNVYGSEMAQRDYSINEVFHAMRKARALSTSDFPDILKGVSASIPIANLRVEHRLFSSFVKVRDFKIFDLISGSDQIEIHQTGELASIKPSVIGLNLVSDQIKSYRGRVLISRQMFVNDSEWLKPLRDSMREALVRKEAELVYSTLEAAAVTDTVAGVAGEANLSLALETFRGLRTDSGSYLNVQATHYVVPAGLEVIAKTAALESGLSSDIRVIGSAQVQNCYMMSEYQPAVVRAGLTEDPQIEFNRPDFETDAIAVLSGLHDLAAVYVGGPVVKVTV